MPTCPTGWEETDGYCKQDFQCVETKPLAGGVEDECGDDLVALDPRSVRSVDFEDDQGDEHILRVGCPDGKWDKEQNRCEVSTVATELLHEKSEPVDEMMD